MLNVIIKRPRCLHNVLFNHDCVTLPSLWCTWTCTPKRFMELPLEEICISAMRCLLQNDSDVNIMAVTNFATSHHGNTFRITGALWWKSSTTRAKRQCNTPPGISHRRLYWIPHNIFLQVVLTHWGRVTHIWVSKISSIDSDNGLSPGRRQAIIWTNGGILFIGPLGTNFSELLIAIHTFAFKKMHLKMSSGKWRPFCLGLNVLIDCSALVGKQQNTGYMPATVEELAPFINHQRTLLSTRMNLNSSMEK